MSVMRERTLRVTGVVGLIVCLVLVACGETAVPTPTSTSIPATETPTIPPTLATQLPDLEISGYGVVYDDCPWGGPGTVSVNLDNFGVGDAGPFEVTINNGSAHVGELGSLEETTASVTFQSGPIGGITAEVDSAQQVVEVDETNNTYTIMFTPPPPCATPTP